MPEAAREVLLDSKTSGTTPRSVWLGMLLCGFLLLGSFADDMFRQDKAFRETFPKLVVGLGVLYASGFRRRISLAPEGIVRRTRSWFASGEDLLPWDQVRHVTLAFKKDEMMAFFEKGTMGWKVLFRREDEDALRKILKEYIPDTEVDTLGR